MTIKQIKLKWEVPPQALERWSPDIRSASKSDDETTINILSTIGEYGDGAGMTARIVSSILRKADGRDIVVNINSPGGDFFEGLAIHTLLSEYEGNVSVRVLGLAASAASVIAMAGKSVEIAASGFLMIHNAWTIALGNKGDMQEAADMLAKFDKSMNDLYAEYSGLETKEIARMMDKETWLQGKDAVDKGFATAVLGKDEVEIDEDVNSMYSAIRKVDVALAKAGMPRSERRDLIKELKGTPSAAVVATPSAGSSEASEVLNALLETLTKHNKEKQNA